MSERVVELEDIKLPLPSSPSGEVILHGDMNSFLIYSTYYASNDRTLKSVLVECEGLSLSRFGYPNDEGIAEHRLSNKGLGQLSGFGEVKDSELHKEYESMSRRSSERIWSGRKIPTSDYSPPSTRHFIVSFKENVFEVVCNNLRLVGIYRDHSSALSDAAKKINLC
jgi:hypothetical protein